MNIERVVNGKKYTFTLEPDELIEAYFEQQDKYDIQDIVDYGEIFSSEELQESFGCTYSELCNWKEEMAAELRRNIDKYDMEFSYARDDAIRTVVRRHQDEKTCVNTTHMENRTD